jgi:hypothetical protein
MSHTFARIGGGAALALLATTLAAPTAHAAVSAPSGLSTSPAGASIPALAWSPVAKATGYQVQVDNDSGFGSPEFNISTVNFRATPTTAIRSGTQYWRVRTVNGSDTSAWREGGAFSVSPVAVPVPTSPGAGDSLVQPDNPPLLQWLGSPGAASYTVEVDGDSDFVGAKTYTTKATSLVVPDPLSEGDWFWRVTAVKSAGLVSLPSSPSSFNILALAKPRLVSPTDSVNTKVNDVVLDWEPVPGARTYDVEISDDKTFDASGLTRATGVQGTRYSPKVTLQNNQFWWRVRAVDLNGQATSWSETNFGFRRIYEDQVQPVFPVGGVGAPPVLNSAQQFYQWNPVPRATEYELWTSADNFSSIRDVCRVAGTTYAPRSPSDCGYVQGGTTYWRVRPIDRPYDSDKGLPGELTSVTQAFQWSGPSASSGVFDSTAEVTGMKVAVNGLGAGCRALECSHLPSTPVFSWDPAPGATRYEVYIGDNAKFTTSILAPSDVPLDTTNTMLTLEARVPSGQGGDKVSTLPDSQAGQPHHWYVRACSASACGPLPISSPDQLETHSFEKTSPRVTGLRASSGEGTEITFEWDDYLSSNLAAKWNTDLEAGNQSGKRYRIQVDSEPSFQSPLLDDQVVDQTTYTASDRLYPEGTLYWRVQATDAEDNGLTWSADPGPVQSQVIKSSPDVPLTSPADGARVSGAAAFRWAPQAYASSYTVEVYRNNDRSFSAANRLFSATVKTPAYAWTQPIPADASPYVWRVRRTDADGNLGPWSTAFAFTSLGAAPALTSPATGSWQPTAGTLFTWTDVPGAASYSLSATSASGSRLASISTPGNAYATTKAIATGTYSWSVTALDAGGKTLGTSPAGSFRVDGTAPTVKSMKPAGSAKPSSVFVVKFSEKVKGLSKKTVRLYQKGKKKPLKAKVVTKGTKATLKPKGKLKKGRTYLVKLTTTRIKDEAGNALVKPKKWSVTIK